MFKVFGPCEGTNLQQPQMREFFRDNTLDPSNIDAILTKEILQLNSSDRNNIYEEIHGVRCMAPEESPQLLQTALEELDAELAKIPESEKRAFSYASGISSNSCSTDRSTPNYVDTDEFRLRFLRCDLFNAQKAARRLVSYLDLITNTLPFEKAGLEVLKRPIMLSDFSEPEQIIIRKGNVQLLPFRDRSGRRVLAVVASLGTSFDPQMWYKICLYFMFIAGDDVETQQKGIVIVVWPNSNISKSTKLQYRINRGGALFQDVFACVPMRVAAIHFCAPSNDPFFQVLRGVLALSLMGGKRSRLIFHMGESVELQYKVNGYGVPVDLLPLTSSGNVKTNYLRQWIKLRNNIEEDIARGSQKSGDQATCNDLIECPGSNDVIFRPGKPVMNHPGNVFFRSVLEANSAVHEDATQIEKTTITKLVVDTMIAQRGGRFLVWNESSCCWKAITDLNQQRHKVAIAFRNFKSQKRALRNRQFVVSSSAVPASVMSNPNIPGDNCSDHSICCPMDAETVKEPGRKRVCLEGRGCV